MTNAVKNTKFLAVIPTETKNAILDDVAKSYQVSREQAYEELTCEGAEHLLDYVTQNIRLATSLMMQKYGLR